MTAMVVSALGFALLRSTDLSHAALSSKAPAQMNSKATVANAAVQAALNLALIELAARQAYTKWLQVKHHLRRGM